METNFHRLFKKLADKPTVETLMRNAPVKSFSLSWGSDADHFTIFTDCDLGQKGWCRTCHFFEAHDKDGDLYCRLHFLIRMLFQCDSWEERNEILTDEDIPDLMVTMLHAIGLAEAVIESEFYEEKTD